MDPEQLPVFLRDHAGEIEATSYALLPGGPERNAKVALQWVKTAPIARVVHRSGILPQGVWPPSLARSFFYHFREHRFHLHDLQALHLDPEMIPAVGTVEKIGDLFGALGHLGEMAVYELRRAVDEAVSLDPDLFEDEIQEADWAVAWGGYWSPGQAAEEERGRRKVTEARRSLQSPGDPPPCSRPKPGVVQELRERLSRLLIVTDGATEQVDEHGNNALHMRMLRRQNEAKDVAA